MNTKQITTPFVLLPHRLQEIGLQPKHILVYAAIRRYMSSENRQAFPSNVRIAKMLGMDRGTVSKLVKQLLERGAMTATETTRRTAKGHALTVYHFPPEKRDEQYERIALPLLLNSHLDWELRAYVIALLPYLFKQPDYTLGVTTYTDAQIADRILISRSAVKSYNKRLQELGYLILDDTIGQESRLFLLREMGQELSTPPAKQQPTERELQMQAKVDELLQEVIALRRRNADQQAALQHAKDDMSRVKNVPQKSRIKHTLEKELAKQQRAADAEPYIMTT